MFTAGWNLVTKRRAHMSTCSQFSKPTGEVNVHKPVGIFFSSSFDRRCSFRTKHSGSKERRFRLAPQGSIFFNNRRSSYSASKWSRRVLTAGGSLVLQDSITCSVLFTDFIISASTSDAGGKRNAGVLQYTVHMFTYF